MNRFFYIVLSVFLVVAPGCANEPAAPANGLAVVEPQQETQETKQEDDSISGKVANLLGQAKEKTPSLDDMKKMLSDAGDATGQTADDTMKWVNEMYDSLSKQGLTHAKDAQTWVAEDWNAINAWEYKVVSVDSKQIASNPEVLEEKLNEAGKQRWECFHVSDGIGGTMFYMKRQKKSYLKNVPLKDMLKLIPLLDGGEQ